MCVHTYGHLFLVQEVGKRGLLIKGAESRRASEARRRWLLEGREEAGAELVFPRPWWGGPPASALPGQALEVREARPTAAAATSVARSVQTRPPFLSPALRPRTCQINAQGHGGPRWPRGWRERPDSKKLCSEKAKVFSRLIVTKTKGMV